MKIGTTIVDRKAQGLRVRKKNENEIGREMTVKTGQRQECLAVSLTELVWTVEARRV